MAAGPEARRSRPGERQRIGREAVAPEVLFSPLLVEGGPDVVGVVALVSQIEVALPAKLRG